MIGNVAEWTNDIYTMNLGTIAVIDPVGASFGTAKVRKGDQGQPRRLRHANRDQLVPSNRATYLGFRLMHP